MRKNNPNVLTGGINCIINLQCGHICRSDGNILPILHSKAAFNDVQSPDKPINKPNNPIWYKNCYNTIWM